MVFTVILRSGVVSKFNSNRYVVMNYLNERSYVFYSYEKTYAESDNISTQAEFDSIDAVFDTKEVIGIVKSEQTPTSNN